MKVKQLIDKLKKMPQENKVIFVNSDVFLNGAYEVDRVDDYQDGTVVLDSLFKKNYWKDEIE